MGQHFGIFDVLSQALLLTPYIAIAAGILLDVTIGIICYRQLSRR
jgi:hypothetical protein